MWRWCSGEGVSFLPSIQSFLFFDYLPLSPYDHEGGFFLTRSYFFIKLSFRYANSLSDVLMKNQVWNSQGTLLGKFFLWNVSANFIFAGDGRLVILAETKIFLASIAAQENRLEFPQSLINWMNICFCRMGYPSNACQIISISHSVLQVFRYIRLPLCRSSVVIDLIFQENWVYQYFRGEGQYGLLRCVWWHYCRHLPVWREGSRRSVVLRLYG